MHIDGHLVTLTMENSIFSEEECINYHIELVTSIFSKNIENK